MEDSTFTHHDGEGYLVEQRESHWQPALRPDDEDSNLAQSTQTCVLADPTSQQTSSVTDSEPRLPSDRSHATRENGSDEDDGRLDPAWGIKRTDSAHILDSARRSSSFPAMSSPEALEVTSKTPLDQGADQVDDLDFNEMLGKPQADDGSLREDRVEDNLSMVIGAVNGVESGETNLTENDARFEEGIPLIAESQESMFVADVGSGTGNNVFEGVDGDDEGAFFSDLQTQPVEPELHKSLDRKSTSEVLDALTHTIAGTAGVTTNSSPFPFETTAQKDLDNEEVDFGTLLAGGDDATGNDDAKWAAVLDDDEFLVDDADDLLPDSEPGSPSSFTASLQNPISQPVTNTSVQPQNSRGNANSFTPHQPSTTDMTQLPTPSYGNVGFSRPGLGPMGSFQNQIQQQPLVSKAQSFADQAKGGYKSPYDLPMDIAKPLKRPQGQRATSQAQQGIPPPPRSSSMSSQKQLQSPFTPTNTTFGFAAASSATQSPSTGNRVTSAPTPSQTGPVRPPSTSSFFEELPITSKPRPNTGRYTPSHNATVAPPQLPPPSPPRQSVAAQPAASPPRKADSFSQFQLRPPERVDPYANIATQPTPTAIAPTVNSRYSPALGTLPGVPRPTASPRYSPAPPTQPPAGPGRYVSQPVSAPQNNAALAFQPRTSSPLAYQGKPSGGSDSTAMLPPPLPTASQVRQPVIDMLSPATQIPPPQPSGPTFSPPRASDPASSGHVPPPRSQTQSPSRQTQRSVAPGLTEGVSVRPASAYAPVATTTKHYAQSESSRSIGRSRAVNQDLDFEQPQDETQHDPLQRWKGAPIFNFGFGGIVVSSFPRHTPRYKSGSTAPQIKATAGEVRSGSLKDKSLLPDYITTFPGPLKGKSKKKDLLNWMTAAITRFENESLAILGVAQELPDPRKCHEEKILLWKIVRVFVEFDGVLENKVEALKALNVLLSPEVHAIDEATASQYRDDTALNGIYSPAGASVRTDSTDPQAVEIIRKHLLKGEREQAVWKAADSRLWSHALLLASTFKDPKVWRQVVQEFVRQEVKTIGNNSESLSALYEIFGGNMEESIDQLVPPSARAGLQMVSKIDSAGPTKNALDGLDRWKETLSLVLNNRSHDDQRALATLGALLGSYGRIEAAHICFLFARGVSLPSIFGGIDDPQASITLLGSDQKARPFTFHQDNDALMLTEAYEFAVTALATTTASIPMPHLAVYKYQRALELADSGFKTEAQAYCDVIASGITSKSKVSPYFHASLLLEVDELAKRLKQVPVQSTSWIAKPSVERATSSLLSKLSNFVAGDDSDADSKGSGADVGPFAKANSSPVLSRSESQTDLYGSYPNATPSMPITAASSRYAPGAIASNRSSSELARGRPSIDSQRSPPGSSYGHESRPSMYAASSIINKHNQSPARSVGSYQPLGTSPSRNNYQATPPQTSYMANVATSLPSSTPPEQKPDSYVPYVPSNEQSPHLPAQGEANQFSTEQPTFGGYAPPVQPLEASFQQTSMLTEENGEQSQSYGYGYEPPADTGYVPYQPDPDSDEDQSKKSKPKKKSFMDDDDNNNFSRLSTQSANSAGNNSTATTAQRKANDEAADAAFRAAAEADAQRAKELAAQKKASGSWISGWFGGSKKGDSLDAAPSKSSNAADSKVYKAKLGEDKMKLYYDKDLKKWVNPDDPDSMKTKVATPPPPPGRSPAPPMGGAAPPPRSTGTPAPPMPISRSSTPASVAGGEGLPGTGIAATLPPSVNAGLGLPSAGTPPPGGAPPSRPVSNASSIDDLIGPATGSRKGAKGGRAQKKGRYVDVMAQ